MKRKLLQIIGPQASGKTILLRTLAPEAKDVTSWVYNVLSGRGATFFPHDLADIKAVFFDEEVFVSSCAQAKLLADIIEAPCLQLSRKYQSVTLRGNFPLWIYVGSTDLGIEFCDRGFDNVIVELADCTYFAAK